MPALVCTRVTEEAAAGLATFVVIGNRLDFFDHRPPRATQRPAALG
ncbi:hypothetical protein ACCQ10_01775 [Xanthomonas sp. NCPPB 1325]